jgi:hypothetical protein
MVGDGVGMCSQAHSRRLSILTVAAQLYWLSRRPKVTAYEHLPSEIL